jgi:hypothetical protein
MNLTAVKTKLAAALAANVDMAPSLQAHAYQPGSIGAVPAIFPSDERIDYDLTHGRGHDRVVLTLRLLVSPQDNEAGQRLLDALASGSGPASVPAAILAVRGAPGEAALGGACDDLTVQTMNGVRLYEHGGITYLGTEFTVLVIGKGDINDG